jgi:phage-related protein
MGFKDFMNSVGRTFSSGFDHITKGFKGVISPIFNQVGGFANNVVNKTSGIVQSVIHEGSTIVQKGIGLADDLGKKGISTVDDLGKKGIDLGESAVHGITSILPILLAAGVGVVYLLASNSESIGKGINQGSEGVARVAPLFA